MSSKTLGQQVAIVTGASSGIGRATAIALAIEGAIVIVNHFPSEEALTPKPSSARLVTPGERRRCRRGHQSRRPCRSHVRRDAGSLWQA
jgi:NAD(P)-dependent dehydrogenase (short-subunit alcohol dehydrogenase family)